MWFQIWLLTALNRQVQSIRGALIKNLFIRQRAYVEILSTRKAWRARKRSKSCSRRSSATELDCEQSLFFFRFSKSNARARGGEAARRAKRGRQPEKPLPSRAISHARGHLRVSRFPRRTTEKERLLVVYY